MQTADRVQLRPAGEKTTQNARVGTYEPNMDDEMERLFSALRPRHRVVLELRYGLRGNERETLATVGRRLRVTKERVRQLENEALAKLRHQGPGLGNVSQQVLNALNRKGGVSRFDHLVDEVRTNITTTALSMQGFVKLALRLDKRVVNVPVKGTEVWALRHLPTAAVQEIHSVCVSLLEAAGRTLSFHHAVSQVRKRLPPDYALDRAFVAAAIMVCPKVTILDEAWLLYGSPYTHTRLLECVNILRQAGQALHYTAIAGKVNDWFARQSSAHATWELLRRNSDVFVKVAPATFGLRWRLDKFVSRPT